MQQDNHAAGVSPLKCFEFYSGIGGMHCALAAAFPDACVSRAFDISPAANDAYEFVFGTRPWQVSDMLARAASNASLDRAQCDAIGSCAASSRHKQGAHTCTG
jgi:site-specific DNA-cytosine methylase